MMTDRNLNAYYYGFEPTGCDLVDAVLEQVARAGKAFHSTEDWNEEDTDGRSPAAKMQAAANASAQAILALIAENKKLRDEASTAKAQCEHAEMCGDDFIRMNNRLEAELKACAATLPGTYYMDPPDGGDVSVPEQLRRMAKDAERYRHIAGRLQPDLGSQYGVRWPADYTLASKAENDAAIDAAMSKGGQANA